MNALINRSATCLSFAVVLVLTMLVFAPMAWAYPTVNEVKPYSASIGETIRVLGSDFGSSRGEVWLHGNNEAYAGVKADIVSWAASEIKAMVPQGAYGQGIWVKKSNGDRASDFWDFYVEPHITGITPNTASAGQVVTINGGGFMPDNMFARVHLYSKSTGDQTVGGMDYPSWSTSRIQFKVPDLTQGTYQLFVDAYISGGTERIDSNRVPFTISGNPAITSVSPNPCPAGATVTVNGSGFGDVDDLDTSIWFEEIPTGTIITPPQLYCPSWSDRVIELNSLPSFNGTFHIVVSRGVSAPATMGGATSAEAEIVFTSEPIPPQDVVVATSRAWAHDSIGAPAPATEWYLPEGSTSGGDETWVLVQNPGDSNASIQITYITSSQKKTITDSIPADSRKTYNAAAAFPDNPGVSAKVESDTPVVAEKSVYGNNRAWGHDSIGISEPATEWYLAEGSTAPGFATRVSIMNPNSSPAEVDLTYMTTSGPVKGPSETLPANYRKSYDVSDKVKNAWEVSTRVTSDKPVAAERAMFGDNAAWAHDSIGVSELDTAWYLAEGSTAPGFETWVLVQNPGSKPANVSLTYMTPNGAVAGPSVALPPRSRKSFEVSKTVADTWEVSTEVTSDQPVVAERAMYGNNRTWATDSVGVSEPVSATYLAEGCTLAGFESWVLVQNPNNSPASATITYMTPTGPVRGPSEMLPPNSRRSYNIAYTVNGVADVSTMVVSDSNIVVERAMYGDRK